MGYQFAIQELRHPATIIKGDKLNVSVAGENQGIGPFYYRWPMELALLDEQGELVEKLPLDRDIRKWLPGKFQEQAAQSVAAKPGTYQLGLGIRDPWTDRPSMKFANDLPTRNGWTIVSSIEIR